MPRPLFLRRRRHLIASPSTLIPGQPAYRNRPGRTGLDPRDAYREQGYMFGWIIRKFFTGSVRTSKITYLTFMLLGGLFFLLPLLICAVRCLPRTGDEVPYIGNIIELSPWAIIGLGLLFSFVVNLLELTRSSPGDDDSGPTEQ